MIVLPFLFLGFWFLRTYKSNKMTPGNYMILLYLIAALASIIIEANSFYTDSCIRLPLGFFTPLLYCFLLWICISPYTVLKLPQYENKDKLKGLTTILVFYWIVFLITLFVSYQKLNTIFIEQDFVAVRGAQYTGDAESFYNHLSGMPRYLAAICSVLSPSSFIMILLFFYSITYLSYKWWYNILLIIPSITPLLISANIADRSMFVYWVILFGFCFTLFEKSMTTRTKRGLLITGISIISIFAVYFIAVTIARFAMRDSGTSGGIITYLGENYINFCNWVNYVEPGFYLDRILPITGHYILPIDPIPAKLKPGITGYELNGFGSFLGSLYGSAGLFFLFFYCFCYNVLSTKVVRIVSKRKVFSFTYFFLLFGLCLVVVLGLFGHYYSTENCVFGLIGWLLIGGYLQRRNHIVSRTK